MSIYNELSKTLIDLLIKEPYYGYFFMNLLKKETTSIPTMAVGTNGIDVTLYFNRDFWKSLNKDQKTGLCIHESLHIIYHHLLFSKDYSNHKIHNIACDLEINQYIPKHMLPETGIFLEDFAREFPKLNLPPFKGSDYYYKELMKDPQNIDKLESMLGDGETHYWDISDLTPEEISMIKDQIDHLIARSAEDTIKNRGNVPGNISYILSLRKKELPSIDWKKNLRQWISQSEESYVKTSAFKPNVFFSNNPSYKWRQKELILLAIDTSGSVSNEELEEFLIEISSMHKLNKVFDILCIDTKIQEPYRYKGELSLKVSGRGGTDFDVMIDYFDKSKKYTSMLFFTDGECSISKDSTKPMMWVLSRRGTDEYIKNDTKKKILKIK